MVLSPFEVSHTSRDPDDPTKKLKSLPGETRAVMEYTGYYHVPGALVLQKAGIYVSAVNAMLTHDYGNNSLRRTKTDKKDAVKLANYALDHWLALPGYLPEEDTRFMLKTYYRQYEQISKMRTMQKNNIAVVIYHGHKAQYEKLYAQYRQIKKAGGFGAERKAQKALDAANSYYHAHDTEIVLFEATERYLKDVIQERFDPKKLPPIRKWEAERDKLKAESQQLSHRYDRLENEVKEVEQIRRNVYSILKEERCREQPKRNHNLEL